MPHIKVFTAMLCPYCTMAKRLLSEKGVEFEEIDVTMDAPKRAEMTELAGGSRTVPQIFIGERHIGGFDDLSALDRAGELDPLLS